MLKKLPIGIQTFKKIRSEDYLYVDKTKIALELISNNSYIFLSRPRRFGKSLFIDTIHNIYEGYKEYFKDLHIYDNWDWDIKYPVIKISFAGIFENKESTKDIIISILDKNKERLQLDFNPSAEVSTYFNQLINKASEKYNQKVVILVDEYDKPILDNIEKIDIAKDIRDTLKGFYSQIKDNDEFVKFCMLTGVSKFSRVSIFSGLNNLKDISLNEDFGDICGYTQNDLETVFYPYLKDIDIDKLKEWYNGYNFLGEKVYNPYDILLFIDNKKKFANYWFETGSPSFLINLIKKNNYFVPEFSNLIIEEKDINSFDIENLNLTTIMIQSGFLTIKEMKQKRDRFYYILDFPNKEVRLSFYDYILQRFSSNDNISISDDLYDIFEDANLEQLKNTIKRLFSSIAYNNFTNNEIENYEGFYASVFFTYFAALGCELIAEDVTNKGRIDLTIKFNDRVYIFEFKITKGDPLEQIKEKKYYEKYLSTSKDVYIIGVVFDPKERNISAFEVEKVVENAEYINL
ncbi:MAG: ATP-binding protein [Campylobacterota bacterium]|nr:ATP-binding protein [Campylobacterota bacterium]